MPSISSARNTVAPEVSEPTATWATLGMTTAGEASSAIIRVMKAPIPSMTCTNVIPMSALAATSAPMINDLGRNSHSPVTDCCS